MARKDANSQPPAGYLDSTHAPLNCLVFILPILAAYEIGAWFYPDSNLAPRHFAGFLEQFGLVGHFLPPVAMVLAILIWQAGTDRPWKIDLIAVGGMLAESILWMFPIEGFSILGAKLLASGVLAAPT